MTTWTKVAKPDNGISAGSPIGLLLALTYSTSSGISWSKVNKASGNPWTKVSKVSGTTWTKIAKAT